MEGDGVEFQDWELLHDSEVTGLLNSSDSVEKTNALDLEGIVTDSGGIIRSDYFSLDSIGESARTAVKSDLSENDSSVQSDDPSWIDSGHESPFARKESGELWSDSSSYPSDDHRKCSDLDSRCETEFLENAKIQVNFDEIGDSGVQTETIGSDSGGIGQNEMRFQDVDGDNGNKNGEYAYSQQGSEVPSEVSAEGALEGLAREERDAVVEAVETKSAREEGKNAVVWWKLPLNFLKFCVFRVSPVWTFSVAAAVVGFVILGRRLYKMKRKSRSLQLKVTVDDKKVSQAMSRAARLNEAFSVVRRVPILRPSLPAPHGLMTPWPAMTT